MSLLLKLDKKYELRGSVSFVPYKDGVTVEFFKSNIRMSKKMYLDKDLIMFIKALNGSKTLMEHIDELNLNKNKVLNLIGFLENNCLIQTKEIGIFINNHSYHHVLNFIADYVPYEELKSEFEKLQNSHIVIIGLGAVGSWTALELAKTGIKNFTLVDTDFVESSNLNRSFFKIDDIGTKKIEATKNNLLNINNKIVCDTKDILLKSSGYIQEILNSIDNTNTIVINCADIPNVDTTSNWINIACLNTNTPYIIAGGYNLHLTLLGPTIIPFKTACFSCIQFQLDYNDKVDDILQSKKLERVNRNIGNIAPMAIITSTFVVNETIKLILKSDKLYPTMINKRGNISFFNNKITFSDFYRMPTCKDCSNKYNSIIEDNDEFIDEFYYQLVQNNILIENNNITYNQIIITKKQVKLLFRLLNNNLNNYSNKLLDKCNIDNSCSNMIEYFLTITFNKLNNS